MLSDVTFHEIFFSNLCRSAFTHTAEENVHLHDGLWLSNALYLQHPLNNYILAFEK